MENNIKIIQIKNIVDSFISHDTNKGNVIILDECWGSGRGTYCIDQISALMLINKNDRNKWCTTVDLMTIPDEIFDLYDKLLNFVFCDLGIATADNIFAKDDRIDDRIHGVIAITDNYEIIKFIATKGGYIINNYINGPEVLMKI